MSVITVLSTIPLQITSKPLPTIFTPASSCLGSSNIWEIIGGGSDILLQGPPSISDCLPVPSTNLVYLGPCPQGYSIACTGSTLLPSSTLTLGTCCPSSFTCPSVGDQIQSNLGCLTGFTTTDTLLVTVSQSGSIKLTTTVATSGDAVNAYSVVIQIPVISPVSSTSSNTAISNTGSPTSVAVTETTSATTGATSISQSSSSQSSGLSTSAKAGIGVGVIFGVAIILLIGYFLGWAKKRRLGRTPADHVLPEISHGSEIHMMQEHGQVS